MAVVIVHSDFGAQENKICHYFHYSYYAFLCVLVTLSCPILCDPKDCSSPGFSVHGILQARILEWIAIPSSRGISQPRDRTLVSCIAGRFFTIWATGKSLAWPIRTRPSFPLSQSLPSGSFHKPCILTHQRAQSQKTNQTGHMGHSLV